MKLTADRSTCIGAGLCLLTAPRVFDQDEEGIVVALVEEVPADDLDAARRAVTRCPSGAVRLLAD